MKNQTNTKNFKSTLGSIKIYKNGNILVDGLDIYTAKNFAKNFANCKKNSYQVQVNGTKFSIADFIKG